MITKEMTIGEILRKDMNTAPLFMEMGMHCLGCPHSQSESVEEACIVHGVKPEVLVDKLNAHFDQK